MGQEGREGRPETGSFQARSRDPLLPHPTWLMWLAKGPLTAVSHSNCPEPLRHQGPLSLGTRDHFLWRQCFHESGWGDGSGTIQVPCICCVLYFYYYYYINSISDHQALDPQGWAALSYRGNIWWSLKEYLFFPSVITLPQSQSPGVQQECKCDKPTS